MTNPRMSLTAARLQGLAFVAAGVAGIVGARLLIGRPAAVGVAIGWWLIWLLRERVQCRQWASSTRRDRGIVFFAEAARWLCVRWSFVRVARGLAAGGVDGSIELFRWSSGWRGFLAIPALMSHAVMRRRGGRLAEKIVRYQERHPDRPVDLVGYSSGAYVVLVALESLPDDVTVRTVVLLAPTVWPQYDLTAALRHVNGRLIAVHSRGDWLINGLGPLVFGTADRRHRPAAGMVGFRRRPADDVADRFVSVQHTWRFARSGYFGDHFTVAGSGMARDHLAAWLTGDGVPETNDRPR